MYILYPKDWSEIGIVPEIIIYEPKPYRLFDFVVVKIDGDNSEVRLISQCVEMRSTRGFVRSYKFNNLVSPGKYAIQIIEGEFRLQLGTLGLEVKSEIDNVDLVPALDAIEGFYAHSRSIRFASNGIGKSGTSWLYNILGSLPGIQCFNMAGAGCAGADAAELALVPYSQVYHGHLGYSLGNVIALEQLDFYHLYIYRDLRDIVVSEYFHKFHFQPKDHRPDLINNYSGNLFDLDMIYKWSSTVYAASSVVDWRRSGSCFMVSYESLIESPEVAMYSLLDNLGIPVHINLIRYIMKMNSFEKLSGGRKPGQMNAKSFFRNGIVGDWRNYLSKETSKGIIDRNPDYFRVFGYPTD